MGTLHRGKKYLLAIFTFVCDVEGDRAMFPFFANRNGSIDASRLSLEAFIATLYMQRGCEREHFTHGKQNTYLPIFDSLQVERVRRQHRPLL